MYQVIFDLVVVVLFLTFLFLASKQRNRHFEYYPQSWKAMMLGGALLVLAGGTNLVSTLNQGEMPWGFQWPQILRITGLVAYLAGGSLVVFGLAKWCRSLMRIRNSAMQRLRQLACLKAVLSVTQRRSELDEMLKDSLSQLMNMMGYKIGMIFKPTFRSSEMLLVAHAGVPVKNLFSVYDLYLKNIWYREARSSQKATVTTDVKSLPEYGMAFSEKDGIRSLACVPIVFSGKVLGLLGLYDARADRFSYQEIQFLTSLGETLGVAARRSLVSSKNKRRKDYISAVENLLSRAEDGGSLQDVFSGISTELRRLIDFDHLSLALTAGPLQNIETISVGDSGGILVERRADSAWADEEARRVIKTGEVRIHRNVDVGPEGSWSEAWGMRSRIILPLWVEDSVCGVLSLGHKKPGFYSASDAKWLKPFARSLSQMVLLDKLKRRLEKEKSLNRSLRDFGSKLVAEREPTELVADVASSLVADLPRSFARVMLLSRQRDELINCAVHQIRSEGIHLKQEARFSLDQLPWHRLTLEAKRSMLVNQSDPESLMSNQEARLVMDGRIGSALLVPVMLNQEAVGIVSLGEMRSWDRQPLTEQEIDFVRHKADQLSLALKEAVLRRSNTRMNDRLKRLEGSMPTARQVPPGRPELRDLAYRIANPLTSIRGSAELLKLKESSLSGCSLKYLGNIERGVDRIQESLENFLSSTEYDSQPEAQPHTY